MPLYTSVRIVEDTGGYHFDHKHAVGIGRPRWHDVRQRHLSDPAAHGRIQASRFHLVHDVAFRLVRSRWFSGSESAIIEEVRRQLSTPPGPRDVWTITTTTNSTGDYVISLHDPFPRSRFDQATALPPTPALRPIRPPRAQPFYPSVPGVPEAPPPGVERSFGVEIEYLGEPYAAVEAMANRGLPSAFRDYTHEVTPGWKIVTDASLNMRTIRGLGIVRSGLELVSPVLRGAAGFSQLQHACDALIEANSYIDASCGLHVHVEARNMSVEDVKRVVLGYTEAQAVFDSLMPRHRRRGTNPYCVAYVTRSLAARIAPAQTLLDLAVLLPNKYTTVNLQSFPRFGTIEFRQHPATIEYSKASAWVRLCMAIIESARASRPFSRQLGPLLESLQLTDADASYFTQRAEYFAAA